MKHLIYISSILFAFFLAQDETKHVLFTDDASIFNRFSFFKNSEVTIGQQTWKTHNLNVSKFSNGDEIDHAKTDAAWKKAIQERRPAWRYMNNDSTLGNTYGKLYNWFAVTDSRGLAEEGWKIPDKQDWQELINYLGDDAGHQLKCDCNEIKEGKGNNASGFSAVLGGHCFFNGMFTNKYYTGSWWSTSTEEDGQVWAMQLNANYKEAELLKMYQTFGLSVRLLKEY